MGLEFGKWLMDVAKYMLTALLLASFLEIMNTPGMVAYSNYHYVSDVRFRTLVCSS